MTFVIAQFDLDQAPWLVVELFDYSARLESDDEPISPVPDYMTPPEYLDVSDVDPPVRLGSTYDEATGEWTYPPPPEDLKAVATDMVGTNTAFLAVAVPSPAAQLQQIRTLTKQVNKLLSERYGL